jgi:hypothetical protein
MLFAQCLLYVLAIFPDDDVCQHIWSCGTTRPWKMNRCVPRGSRPVLSFLYSRNVSGDSEDSSALSPLARKKSDSPCNFCLPRLFYRA